MTDRTLLAVTADHGESFDEHGELDENPNNYFHGHHLYEKLLRVPLILCGPSIPRGVSSEALVESIDLAPTIYDYLGLTPGDGGLPMDGVSLRGLIEQQRAVHDFTLSEVWRSDHDRHQVAYRTARYKLIVNYDNAREQLFDLQNDPNERQEESRGQPDVVSELKARLAQVWQPDYLPPAAEMSAAEEAQVMERLDALGYI